MIITGKKSAGILLKQLRKNEGLTLREVVEANEELFHDIPHLSKIESGQWMLDLDKLTEYLRYYNCSLCITQTKS